MTITNQDVHAHNARIGGTLHLTLSQLRTLAVVAPHSVDVKAGPMLGSVQALLHPIAADKIGVRSIVVTDLGAAYVQHTDGTETIITREEARRASDHSDLLRS